MNWALPQPARSGGGQTGTPRLRGWLHFAVLWLAVPAGAAIAVQASRTGRLAEVAVYAVTLVGLYGASSAYHLLPVSERGRARLRQVDHCAIYLLIAGSSTPFCLSVIGGTEGTVLLGVVWAGASAGVVLKAAVFERSRVVAGGLYLMLGWATVVALPRLVERTTGAELWLLVACGVLYTLGAVVLALRWPDPAPTVFGYHEIWHSLVVLASGCLYGALWLVLWP